MIYIFDIDGTLCSTEGKDYFNAEPDEAMIALVNMLYYQGHYIKLFTARGTTSKIDYRKQTEKQLKRWGVKYHELDFGWIISDYVTTPEEFLSVVD